MQKRVIATAIIALSTSGAFAQSFLTIGGKVDAGYQFKKTSEKEADGAITGPTANPAGGGKSTETLGDGGASTSRITIVGKEVISQGYEAGINLDMRFNEFHDGKSTTSSGVGGLTSNDKKLMYLKTPFGQMQWGVINLGDNFYLASKPYMVEPKDLEIVKYGIGTYRYTALSNRVSEYISPSLSVGEFSILAKGQYAIGDQRKSGASNQADKNSGDAFSAGMEFKAGKLLNGGFDWNKRTPSDTASTTGMRYWRAYASVFPVGGLKLAGTYSQQDGYGTVNGTKTGFQDKITNLVVSYNFSNKVMLGAEYSIVRDVGEYRNSGSGWMAGAAYFLSKSTYLYVAHQKSDWQHDVKGVYGGKYDGTSASFSGAADKLDLRYTRLGFVKEF